MKKKVAVAVALGREKNLLCYFCCRNFITATATATATATENETNTMDHTDNVQDAKDSDNSQNDTTHTSMKRLSICDRYWKKRGDSNSHCTMQQSKDGNSIDRTRHVDDVVCIS